jgi:septal ring factor EnvC (AmiA/AmiB activator)
MLEVPGALALIVALASVVVLLVLRLREQGPAAVERAARENARLRDERDALAAELEALTGRTAEARAALRSALDEAAPEVARLEQLRASTTAARDALDALEAELARLRAQRAELAAVPQAEPAAAAPAPQTAAPQTVSPAPARTSSLDLAAVAAAIGTGSAEPALSGRVGATRATEALPADEGEHR